jgi:hypothetical protein
MIHGSFREGRGRVIRERDLSLVGTNLVCCHRS